MNRSEQDGRVGGSLQGPDAGATVLWGTGYRCNSSAAGLVGMPGIRKTGWRSSKTPNPRIPEEVLNLGAAVLDQRLTEVISNPGLRR